MRFERAGMLIGLVLLCRLSTALAADDGNGKGSGERKKASQPVSVKASPDPEKERERTYPSLPGAIRELPEWVTKNAPFDVARHFAVVPPDENAAPLYLDALYEFAPGDMGPSIAPEERDVREPALKERYARTYKLQTQGGDAAERAENLAEYQQSFVKLAQAQKRKRCVFESGLGIDAMLHHAQGARYVVRLLQWSVEFNIADGKIDAALDDVETALRLARDLRPRGPIICQLVSVSLNSVSAQDLIARILSAPGLTAVDCDRLLESLVRYETEAPDSASEGFRVEYLILRDLLHRLELKEPLGDLIGTPGSSNGIVLAKIYGNAPAGKSLEIAEQIDDALAAMTAADFVAEIELLNRCFRPLVEPGTRPSRELDTLLPDQLQAVSEMKLLTLFTGFVPTNRQSLLDVVEAYRRDLTRMGAMQCLVALRRWQLQEGKKLPPDLLTVCKAAGMKTVPVDQYSKAAEMLRSKIFGVDPVVYSVGKDGKDDGAQLDWNWGRTKGDFIFRLPPLP